MSKKRIPYWECKVCGAQPDEEGYVRHGRGCYQLSEDGGGEEYIAPEEMGVVEVDVPDDDANKPVNDTLPELEKVCPNCEGTGKGSLVYDGSRYCPECGGAGYVTTPFGGKVLALMRHNFRVLHRRMTNGGW